MVPIDCLTDLKLKGHLSGTLGPVIAITTLTARKSHQRGIILWIEDSCVQQRYTVDCIRMPIEPTPVEDLNKNAAVAVHCVFKVVRDCC